MLADTGTPQKSKRSGKVRAQQLNNQGPCPSGRCKHPPVDHRPVAGTKDHFCYGKDCMQTCSPNPVALKPR